MLLCHLAAAYLLQVHKLLKKVSDVVITREFAWNPRCVVIICVNSVERSTFDISNSPDVILLPVRRNIHTDTIELTGVQGRAVAVLSDFLKTCRIGELCDRDLS